MEVQILSSAPTTYRNLLLPLDQLAEFFGYVAARGWEAAVTGSQVAVCRIVPIVRAASVMSAISSASASPIVRVSPPRFSAAST